MSEDSERKKQSCSLADWVRKKFSTLWLNEVVYAEGFSGIIRVEKTGERSIRLSAGGMPGQFWKDVMSEAADLLRGEDLIVTVG